MLGIEQGETVFQRTVLHKASLMKRCISRGHTEGEDLKSFSGHVHEQQQMSLLGISRMTPSVTLALEYCG